MNHPKSDAWDPPARILLLALPEVSPGVLYSLYEVFSSVGTAWSELTGEPYRGRRMGVQIVAASSDPFHLENGFPIAPHKAWDEAGKADVIVVPDLAVPLDRNPGERWPEAAAWLRSQHDAGAIVTSVCSGSLLLAASGLLDGLEATTHWGIADLFRRFFPKVKLTPARVLVATGPEHRIITSGGAASWENLALYLIARFCGQRAALHSAKVFLLGDRSEGQLPFAAMTRPKRHRDAVITRCQDWIADNYACANPVQRLVALSHLPERSFKRRFKAATGYSPLDYVQALRIEEAKQLLETTDEPVDSIGQEVGYEDPTFFRRLFKRRVGITPARYRQKFRRLLA